MLKSDLCANLESLKMMIFQQLWVKFCRNRYWGIYRYFIVFQYWYTSGKLIFQYIGYFWIFQYIGYFGDILNIWIFQIFCMSNFLHFKFLAIEIFQIFQIFYIPNIAIFKMLNFLQCKFLTQLIFGYIKFLAYQIFYNTSNFLTQKIFELTIFYFVNFWHSKIFLLQIFG